MKFLISTLLWLTLASACFFAAMSCHDFYERTRLGLTKENVVVAIASKVRDAGINAKDP